MSKLIARSAFRRRRTESGVMAIIVAILLPTVFLGLAATSVDVARWYVEVERVQKAADAAALAGVVFMPQDFTTATARAKVVAKRNHYDDAAASIVVTVQRGSRPSQLRVTISSTIHNTFGAFIGNPSITIKRTGVADYTGPAPMGSPCNTFGTEPAAGSGANSPTPKGAGTSALPSTGGFPNCTNNPQFWADLEGPETGKVQGDRYQTVKCEDASVDGCNSSKVNQEYNQSGYFFVVKILPAAVGSPISLQLYDPAFVNTGQQCASGLPAASALVDNMNPYVAGDGKTRYSTNSGTTVPSMCPGDNWPGTGSGASPKHALVTSFALRQQSDSLDSASAPVQNGSDGKACIRQYGTFSTSTSTYPTVNDLKYDTTKTLYNDQLAKVFHNWVNFCTFTPARAGDYYLQVRTNVTLGGTAETNTNSKPALIYQGNTNVLAANGNTTTGEGSNSFAMRAVTSAGLQKSVAVAGYDRMPIYENGTASTATFNLIQVLPGAAGQQVSYNFFDVSDADAGTGSVQVIPASDMKVGSVAWTSIAGCTTSLSGAAPSNLTACKTTISSSTNNGKVQNVTIPIPTNYTCDYTTLGGCWLLVKVSFASADVHDTTTWDAQIIGDPVRLVE